MSEDHASRNRERLRVPLIAALIAFAGALGGTVIGGAITLEAQDNQFEERRLAQSRAKRERVYTRFINAADRFGVEAVTLYERCIEATVEEVKRERDPGDERALSTVIRSVVRSLPAKRCDPTEMNDARYAYQAALNNLYIYGSDAAVRAEGDISETLPASLVGLRSAVRVGPVDETGFHRAYKGFQVVMCEELPPEPRPTC